VFCQLYIKRILDWIGDGVAYRILWYSTQLIIVSKGFEAKVLKAVCPSCHPTNSIKVLKAEIHTYKTLLQKKATKTSKATDTFTLRLSSTTLKMVTVCSQCTT